MPQGILDRATIYHLSYSSVMDCLCRMLIEASSINWMKGFQMGFNSIQVYQLLFAKDTIIFFKLKEDAIDKLFTIIDSFKKATGFNLNMLEILSICTPPEDLCRLGIIYNFKFSQWPCFYLGLPLFGKPKSVSFWEPSWKRLRKDYHHGTTNISLKVAG